VVAIDGFSRKIVGMIILIKNPITIYNTLMKPLMEVEGLWQQVRIDLGAEFCFNLYSPPALSLPSIVENSSSSTAKYLLTKPELSVYGQKLTYELSSEECW